MVGEHPEGLTSESDRQLVQILAVQPESHFVDLPRFWSGVSQVLTTCGTGRLRPLPALAGDDDGQGGQGDHEAHPEPEVFFHVPAAPSRVLRVALLAVQGAM